jgi:hypothetical protein
VEYSKGVGIDYRPSSIIENFIAVFKKTVEILVVLRLTPSG